MWKNSDVNLLDIYKLLLPICSDEVQILVKRLVNSTGDSLDGWISVADSGTFLLHEQTTLGLVLRKTKLRRTKINILERLNAGNE